MAYVTEQDLRIREIDAQEHIATALLSLAQAAQRFIAIIEMEIEEEKQYQNSLKR